MTDLQKMALRAIAETAPAKGTPNMAATARLREIDGKTRPLREYLDAVEWASKRQSTTTLTRAAKRNAIAELAERLAAVSENRAYADAGFGPFKPSDVKWFNRRQNRLQAAIVRVAMAATTD